MTAFQTFDQSALSGREQPLAQPSFARKDNYWVEEWANNFAYGALNIPSSLLRRVGSFIPGEDPIEQSGGWFQDILDRNPHWAPEQADNVLDLITSPRHLGGMLASQVPYTASMLAISAVTGGVGGAGGAALRILGPAAIAYGVEGQGAYDEAIANGATEEEAETTANWVGTINALIETRSVFGLGRLGGEVKRRFVRRAVNDAAKIHAKHSLPRHLAREAAVQAFEEMTQGANAEFQANRIYGEPISEGFIDRRLQEAVGAAAFTTLFGLGSNYYHKIQAKRLQSDPDLNRALEDEGKALNQRQLLFKELIDHFGKQKAFEQMYLWDRAIGHRARDEGVTRDEMYEQWFAQERQGQPGQIFYQDRSDAIQFVDKATDIMNRHPKKFKKIHSRELLPSLRSRGIKDYTLDWTGLRKLAESNDRMLTREEIDNAMAEAKGHIETVGFDLDNIEAENLLKRQASLSRDLYTKIDEMEERAQLVTGRRASNREELQDIVSEYAQQMPDEAEAFDRERSQLEEDMLKAGREHTELLESAPRHTQEGGGYTTSGPIDEAWERLFFWVAPPAETETKIRASREGQKIKYRIGVDPDSPYLIGEIDVDELLKSDRRYEQIENQERREKLLINEAFRDQQSRRFIKGLDLVDTDDLFKALESNKEIPLKLRRYREGGDPASQDFHNNLFHIRGTYRTENGKRYAVVEEIQSNNQQALEKRNIKGEVGAEGDKIFGIVNPDGRSVVKELLTFYEARSELVEAREKAEEVLRRIGERIRTKLDTGVTPDNVDIRRITGEEDTDGLFKGIAPNSILNAVEALVLEGESSSSRNVKVVMPQVETLPEALPMNKGEWQEVAVQYAIAKALNDGADGIMIADELEQSRRGISPKGARVNYGPEINDKGKPRAKLPIALYKLARQADSSITIDMASGQENSALDGFAKIDFTDKLRKDFPRQIVYGQDKRGYVTFFEDSKAAITLLETADESTFFHEMMHVWARHARPQDQAAFEEWIGKPMDRWTIADHELLAKASERYLYDGYAPNADLTRPFRQFRRYMKSIAGGIQTGYFDVVDEKGKKRRPKVTTELKRAFDQIFAPENRQVEAVRDSVIALEEALEQSKSLYKAAANAQRSDGTNPAIAMLKSQGIEPPDVVRRQLKEKNQDLRTLQASHRDSKISRATTPLIRELEIEARREQPDHVRRQRSRIGTFWRWVASAANFEWAFSDLPSWPVVRQAHDDMHAYAQTIKGRFENEIHDVMVNFSNWDIQWLNTTDEDGFTNARKVVDETGVPPEKQLEPPTKAIAAYRDLYGQIQKDLGLEAEKVGMLRKTEGGWVVPFVHSKYRKMARVLTSHAWEAVHNKAGPLYEAMIDAAVKNNEGISRTDAARAVRSFMGDPLVRKVGMLENVRRVKVMPDKVMVNGRWEPIFHSDPYYVTERVVDLQARRIASVRYFGQGGLMRNPNLKSLAEFAKRMGLQETTVNGEMVKRRLREAGVAEETIKSAKGIVELQKLAKTHLGSRVSISKEELVERLLKLDSTRFRPRQIREMEKFAKQMRGIAKLEDQTGDAVDEMWETIKDRLKNPSIDLIAKWRKRIVSEGGSGHAFDNLMRVSHGLPYIKQSGGVTSFSRTPLDRGIAFLSQLIGSAQTSTAVLPNIPQTIAVVPRMAGIGRLAQAISNTLKDPDFTRSQLAGMGAFQRMLVVRSWESGYRLENFGRLIRQAVAKGTGLQVVSEYNNMIAGEAFRLMAEDWELHGIPKKDLRRAKELRLSQSEIDTINSGSMSPQTKNKIVQNGTAMTQFMSEAAHRKGIFENIPLARVLFAYSNYTFGATRATVRALDDVRDAFTKNPNQIHHATGRMLSLLVGSMGAGMLGSMLREAAKGTPPDEDETFYDRALTGLVEIQLLGATQRMMDPFQYENGGAEKLLISAMPQVKAVTDFLSVVFSRGEYGQFSRLQQAKITGAKHTPLARAIGTWWDRMAYPDLAQHINAKARLGRYKRENLKESAILEAQIDPDYYAVYREVSRGDIDEAWDLMAEMVKRRFDEEGEMPADTIQRLRGALMNRSPLFIKASEQMKFLGSMPASATRDQLREYYRYQSIVDLLTG